MDAKVIVITGASDGIGAAAAKILKGEGHTVVVVGRNPAKTQKVAEELGAPYFVADFARLADVVALANDLRANFPHIDVLANNAGAALAERKLTQDGFEQTFQINVLAPYLLTRLLLPTLCQSRATVVQTSSLAANLFGRSFDVDDLQNENYTPIKAYGRAKLCNILFTRELHRRFAEQGLCAVAFHPGIPRTNFACESSAFLRIAYHSPLKYLFTTPKRRSAERLAYFAKAEAGKDFECGEAYTLTKKFKVKYKDPDGVIAQKLWQSCEELLKNYLADVDKTEQ